MTQQTQVTDPDEKARWCKQNGPTFTRGIWSCPRHLQCVGCDLFEDSRPPDQIPSTPPLRAQIALWIDPHAIADLILETLTQQAVPLTFEAAKELWLDTLEHLGEYLNR